MRAVHFTFAVLLVGCGAAGGGRRLTFDAGSGDLSACKGEKFACNQTSDCCPGLACIGNVCTNPLADMALPEPKPDLAQPDDRMGAVCSEVLDCQRACQDDQCWKDCIDTASGSSQMIYRIAYKCIFGDMNGGGACPEFNGGVCDYSSPRFDPNACDECLNKAESVGGVCYKQVMACLVDCNSNGDCASATEQMLCSGPCTCMNLVCN